MEYLKPIIQRLEPFPGFNKKYLLTPQGEVISLKTNKKLAVQVFTKSASYQAKTKREKYVKLSRNGKALCHSIRFWCHKLYPKRFKTDLSKKDLHTECYVPWKSFIDYMKYLRRKGALSN